MPSNTRSAEWLQGGIDALEDLANAFETPSLRLLALECRNRAAKHRTLLAAAEAREGTQPTAADVIEACERACAYTGSDIHKATELTHVALDKIARWKEANVEKP